MILVALTMAGLLFQLEGNLDRFLIVTTLQSVVYAVAVWLCWTSHASRRVLLAIAVLAILMRVPVTLAPPYLSVDVYRYVWDGEVEAAGFNPYLYAPSDPKLEAIRDHDIYPQIGSPYAPTIYPPVAEGLFLLVTRVSASVTAMKFAMVIFEAITFVLLARLLVLEGLPTSRVLVYAWHPLPIWEFPGNGHIDAPLIAFCVTALWAMRRQRSGLGGLFLAGATLTKLYPVVLLPALYRRWDWRLLIVFVVAIVVGYLPFVSAGSRIIGFLPGYASQEGFNAQGAGFYLLDLLHCLPGLSALDAKVYVLAAIAILAVLSAVFIFRRNSAPSPYAMAAALAGLFMVFVSPHYPWYFAWLIVFACFVRSFALVWLTNACFLLYLPTDYVFLPSAQLLVTQSIIYGPFAALAIVDFWHYRRREALRS
ncbi:MAG: glycosyltransferase family 87 protein [Stellaceae bacterium]